ncbi:phosphatidylinositol phospholipase [Coccidioides posadasii str. Silveira]|uniref:Phosphatidylinositol phospholipase n=1 Tax=Coccidioides posadasii (strain RMSCC 757 / Silveira) TaxID=443226 RepID=E9CVQ2_COCPS|nr:phosphatidylinositol phospholipase [Coccidioides posadasii str. Silveira]
MVAEYLTIRNLTPNPIELKHVERFAPPDVPKPDIKNITKSFATLMNNITRSANEVDAIAHGSEAVSKEDVSVRVEPFTAVKTEIRAYKNSEKERLKLTVEVEGERHQVQTPVPTSDSATMKALKDKPRFRLTVIYITPESHLTIFLSANLNSWMKELKDETLLSALSIPGTHNSPTCHVAPPSVRCQAVSPREQLESGVRFFDIRVQPQYPDDPSKDNLVLVHSVFPISLTGNKYFRDLVNEIEGFLQRNPSETLIMSVKREGPGKHTDAQLSKILHDHYARDPHKWYTEPKVPRLEVARGKIVLIRRFGLDDSLKKQWNGRGWGIDATGWADNTPHANCPSGHVCIQDFYEVLETENIDKKIEYVTAQLARSAALCYPLGGGDDEKDRSPFYVNFLSASNFWKVQTWPEKIAAKLNPATVDYICRKHSHDKDGDWSTGILVCDWVGLDGDWDLVRCIVGMNTRLMMKQR